MKCAILILALVAVSQAAFSNNLQQRAQPILRDAITKMHGVGGRASFRESEITSSIVQTLQEHANSILAQIDSAVQTGQEVAANLVDQFQSTVAQLAALGSDVHGEASSLLSNLLSNLGGIFGGIFGGLGKNGVLSQTIVDMINQWNIEHHVSNALSSNYVQWLGQWISQLINSMGASTMVTSAVNSVMGEELGNWILGHFNAQNGKGIFDGLASMGSSLSAAAQQAMANIQTTIGQIVNVASTSFAQLQQLATQFAHEALGQAQATASQAAANFLAFLKPYQQDMGELYQTVVAQISAIV